MVQNPALERTTLKRELEKRFEKMFEKMREKNGWIDAAKRMKKAT